MVKNRILFGVLFLSALVFVYFYGGKIPYMFIYVMISLPLLSFLYTGIIAARLKFSQETDKSHGVKGEIINYMVSVKNRDFVIVPYINIKLSGVESFYSKEIKTISHSLAPFQEKKFSFALKCSYRGIYEIGIKAVEIEDFLGILKFRRKTGKTVTVKVYPRIVNLEKFGISGEFLHEAQNVKGKAYEDLSAISDIRKYQYGDSFKKIHWKLSAKMNDLMVKNYQTTSRTKTVMFLDLSKGRFSEEKNIIIEDKLMEAAVAVLQYLLRNRVELELVYHTEEFIRLEASNPGDFDGLYEVLAGVPFVSQAGLKKVVGMYVNDYTVNTKYIILTSNINDPFFGEIPESNLYGHKAQLIYISPSDVAKVDETRGENTLQALAGSGMDIYKINIKDNVKEILER